SLDGLLAFSVAPLYFIATLGLGLTVLGAVAWLISLTLLCGAPYQSQTFLICLIALLTSWITLMTGVGIGCTGIVAIYQSKILDETRARPTYIVGNRLGRGFAGLNQAGLGQVQAQGEQQLDSE